MGEKCGENLGNKQVSKAKKTNKIYKNKGVIVTFNERVRNKITMEFATCRYSKRCLSTRPIQAIQREITESIDSYSQHT